MSSAEDACPNAAPEYEHLHQSSQAVLQNHHPERPHLLHHCVPPPRILCPYQTHSSGGSQVHTHTNTHIHTRQFILLCFYFYSHFFFYFTDSDSCSVIARVAGQQLPYNWCGMQDAGQGTPGREGGREGRVLGPGQATCPFVS